MKEEIQPPADLPEFVEVKVRLRLDMWPGATKGMMYLVMEGATVKNQEGQEVGAIRSIIGGGAQVSAPDGTYWSLSSAEIWNALCSSFSHLQPYVIPEPPR